MFIVLEGLDGAGSTTQSLLLYEWLRTQDFAEVLVTAEPTRGPVGSLIRTLYQGTGHREEMPPSSMALLFAADRNHHIQSFISPALEAGSIVVCDRYFWSSLAYQTKHSSWAWVESLAKDILMPDISIFVDTPTSVCRERVRKRAVVDAYEDVPVLEWNRRQLAYQACAASLIKTKTAHIVDGKQTVEEIHDEICAIVTDVMG